MRRRTILGVVAVSAVVLDQGAKAIVRATMAPVGTSVPVIDGLVRLTYTLNTGAAFGMLPGHGAVFVVVSTLVLCSILIYAWRWRPTRLWVVVALGLVAGGASGNLVDRLVVGRVTDFIQLPFNFPVFNLADSCIVIGIAMLVWWLLFGPAPAGSDPAADEGAVGGPSAEPSAREIR